MAKLLVLSDLRFSICSQSEKCSSLVGVSDRIEAYQDDALLVLVNIAIPSLGICPVLGPIHILESLSPNSTPGARPLRANETLDGLVVADRLELVAFCWRQPSACPPYAGLHITF